MGLFSRKKQAPLPPLPRYPAPSGQQPPSYEPEFPHPESLQGPEFPEVHAEPVTIPPPPSFPRPQVDDKSQPAFVRMIDERLPTRQEPIVQPRPIIVSHPEAVRLQQPVQPLPRPAASIEIPAREPAFLRKPVQYPDRQAVANNQAAPWQRQEQPRPIVIPDRPLPPPMMPPQPVTRPSVNVSLSSQQPAPTIQPRTMHVEDKPLFIKIGQYREAMSHLELLKQKIKDAETALAKLEELRAKEQEEIIHAHDLLATVKEKLLTIDKQLFEV